MTRKKTIVRLENLEERALMSANSVTLQNGLLTIELQREVPEALKPRRIEIRSEGAAAAQVEPRQIEAPKAA